MTLKIMNFALLCLCLQLIRFGDIPAERRTAMYVIMSVMHRHQPEEIAQHMPENVPLARYWAG